MATKINPTAKLKQSVKHTLKKLDNKKVAESELQKKILSKEIAKLQSNSPNFNLNDTVNYVLKKKLLLDYLIRTRQPDISNLVRQLGLPFTPTEIHAELKKERSYFKHLLQWDIIYVLIIEYIYELRRLEYLREQAYKHYELAIPHKKHSLQPIEPDAIEPHIENDTRDQIKQATYMFIELGSILDTDLALLEEAKECVLKYIKRFIMIFEKQEKLLDYFFTNGRSTLSNIFNTDQEYKQAIIDLADNFTNIHTDIRETSPELAKVLAESLAVAESQTDSEHTLTNEQANKNKMKGLELRPKSIDTDPEVVEKLLKKLKLSQDLQTQIRLIPLLKKLGINNTKSIVNELNGDLGKLLLKYNGLEMQKQLAEHKIQQAYNTFSAVNERCNPNYQRYNALLLVLGGFKEILPIEKEMRLNAQKAYEALQLPKDAMKYIKHPRPTPLRTSPVMNPFGWQ